MLRLQRYDHCHYYFEGLHSRRRQHPGGEGLLQRPGLQLPLPELHQHQLRGSLQRREVLDRLQPGAAKPARRDHGKELRDTKSGISRY